MSARAAFVILTATLVASACTTRPLEQLPEARRVSEDRLVPFTKAADASNRVVMADTDEASVRFAREAGQMVDTVQKDADALKPLLQDLGYADEARLLEEFGRRFAEYRALDRTILELVVQNTNLKAHAETIASSRRNTNVRSLALTLDQKGKLTPPCEDALRALRDGLAKRSVGGTR